MTRQQALKGLENLFKTGFSYLDVRAYLNKIYDSIESSGTVGNNKAKEKGKININSLPSKAYNHTISDKNNMLDKWETENYNISKINPYSYSLMHSVHGRLIYFPKSNKIQRTKDNYWLENGFDYIIKNLKSFK